jgi:hypothetical protein
VAAAQYKAIGGRLWVKNATLTAALFSVPTLLVSILVHVVNLVYRKEIAMYSWNTFTHCVVWVFITFSPTLLGAVIAISKTTKVCAPNTWPAAKESGSHLGGS